MEFLKPEMFENIMQEENTEQDVFSAETAMRVANINGFIPQRFATARLADYPVTFVDEVKNFALNKKNDKVFLITGSVGTGKSTLLCASMHERAINGLSEGFYLSMRMLCPMIRTSRSFSAKENEEQLYQKYATVPFLVIDEVGRGEVIDQERCFIRTVLALRYDNMLPTMIGTNMSIGQFKVFIAGDVEKTATDDILDRLNSTIIAKAMVGESRRGIA